MRTTAPLRLVAALAVASLLLTGCQTSAPLQTEPSATSRVETPDATPAASGTNASNASPPTTQSTASTGDWQEFEPARHERSVERAWRSPSGLVTVGVVDVDLPFAVPAVMIIDGYRDDIRKEEGDAKLSSNQGSEGETHFTVAGSQRVHDVILTKQGKKAHFYYIRTSTTGTPPQAELAQAAARRDALREAKQ